MLKGLTIGVKTKDLSLASTIKEWSGQTRGKSVTEFLTQIEQCARISNWGEIDLVNITKTKLTSDALRFVSSHEELTKENVKWEILKTALIDRFSEKLPLRYHYNLLHEATQGKDESPTQFLDRCRTLSGKTIRQTADPIEQRILKKEADCRLLTSFMHGIKGETGHELRIRNPKTIEQALSIATVVYNAKRVEPRYRNHEVLAVRHAPSNKEQKIADRTYETCLSKLYFDASPDYKLCTREILVGKFRPIFRKIPFEKNLAIRSGDTYKCRMQMCEHTGVPRNSDAYRGHGCHPTTRRLRLVHWRLDAAGESPVRIQVRLERTIGDCAADPRPFAA
jgi:hypothetical protein